MSNPKDLILDDIYYFIAKNDAKLVPSYIELIYLQLLRYSSSKECEQYPGRSYVIHYNPDVSYAMPNHGSFFLRNLNEADRTYLALLGIETIKAVVKRDNIVGLGIYFDK